MCHLKIIYTAFLNNVLNIIELDYYKLCLLYCCIRYLTDCPAQAFSYAYGSLDLFLTPTVTAAPYICQFTVAVPAPYTQFRIACPLMKGYGLSGTGNIVAYDLGLVTQIQ